MPNGPPDPSVLLCIAGPYKHVPSFGGLSYRIWSLLSQTVSMFIWVPKWGALRKHASRPHGLACRIWLLVIRCYEHRHRNPSEKSGPLRPAFQGHSRSSKATQIVDPVPMICISDTWAYLLSFMRQTTTQIFPTPILTPIWECWLSKFVCAQGK